MNTEISMEFCPHCGEKGLENTQKSLHCPKCDFLLYKNVAASVGLILYTDDGKILLEKRAKNPRKDFLAVPGGFIDPDETAEHACIRECFEEIGLQLQESDIHFLCSAPNTYPYKSITYKSCDSYFYAKFPQNLTLQDLKLQKCEVENIEFYDVSSINHVNNLPLAFDALKSALIKWVTK